MAHGPAQLVALAAASAAAGLVNALAGGGTLITFPVLGLLGLPPVSANVTSALALCPGYVGASLAQRRLLAGQGRRLALLLPLGLAGGLAGGLLLLHSPERVFRALVPFLILLAAGLLAFQEPLRRLASRRERGEGTRGEGPGVGAAAALVLAAVYGGYFGAGVSVVILAVLGLSLGEDLVRLSALKQTLALAANLAAALLFGATGPVDWPLAGFMAAGALVGGALGGVLANRLEPAVLRAAVVGLGLVLGLCYLLVL